MQEYARHSQVARRPADRTWQTAPVTCAAGKKGYDSVEGKYWHWRHSYAKIHMWQKAKGFDLKPVNISGFSPTQEGEMAFLQKIGESLPTDCKERAKDDLGVVPLRRRSHHPHINIGTEAFHHKADSRRACSSPHDNARGSGDGGCCRSPRHNPAHRQLRCRPPQPLDRPIAPGDHRHRMWSCS